MSEKLRFFDPQLKEKPEIELFNEPEWLIHLRQLDGQIRVKKTELMFVSVCKKFIYSRKAFLYSGTSICLWLLKARCHIYFHSAFR